MEKNYSMPTRFFYKCIWSVLFFPLSIFPESTDSLKGLDSTQYPNLQVEFHSKYEIGMDDSISVIERSGEVNQIVSQVRLRKKEEPNRIRFILSLPSYSGASDRTWFLQLARSLVDTVEGAKGESILHIQSDSNFHLYEKVRASELGTGFPYPKEPKTKKPIEGWRKLLEPIEKENGLDTILLLVSFEEEWFDRIQIPDFARELREKQIKVLVLSPQILEANKLVGYANGEFYQISHKESYAKLFQELRGWVSPNYILEYESPWNFSKWDRNEIQVSVKSIDRSLNLEFVYELSLAKSLGAILRNPFVFFPVIIFLIALCFSALFYLRGFESRSYVAELPILSPSQESADESMVYDHVYGETIEKANRDREIAAITKEPIPLSGKTYEIGFLIRRDASGNSEKNSIQTNEFFLGRSERNHLVIRDPLVSLVHAKVKKVKGKFILFDCASDGGVYLNGKRLLRPKALHDLDEIQVGKTSFSFRGR